MLTLPEFETIFERVARMRAKATVALEEIRSAMMLLDSEMGQLLPDEGEELVALPLEHGARVEWLRAEEARLAALLGVRQQVAKEVPGGGDDGRRGQPDRA